MGKKSQKVDPKAKKSEKKRIPQKKKIKIQFEEKPLSTPPPLAPQLISTHPFLAPQSIPNNPHLDLESIPIQNPRVPPFQSFQYGSNFDKTFNKCLEIFPYSQPYQSQVESMKKIAKILVDKKNLLFESPTGTGKTLLSICCALAYKAEVNHNIQIIFLTRTNEQVNGFIKEISKIGKEYSPKYAILVGKNSMCHKIQEIRDQQNQQEQIKFPKAIEQYCKDHTETLSPNSLLKKKREIPVPSFDCLDKGEEVIITRDFKEKPVVPDCIHYRITEAYFQNPEEFNDYQYPYVKIDNQDSRLPDIEDIKLLFDQENLGCPYFYNKKIVNNADIVFTNYNYLIKQSILDLYKSKFRDNVIVIFDEAHNVTEQAENELKFNYKINLYTILMDNIKLFQNLFKKNNHAPQIHFDIYMKFLNAKIENEVSKLADIFDKQFGKKEKYLKQGDAASQNEDTLLKEEEQKFQKQVTEQFDLFNRVELWITRSYQSKIQENDSDGTDDEQQYFDDQQQDIDKNVQGYDSDFQNQIQKLYSLIVKARRVIIGKVKSQNIRNDNENEKEVFKIKILKQYQELRLNQFLNLFKNLQRYYQYILETCNQLQQESNSRQLQFYSLMSEKYKMDQFFVKFKINELHTIKFLRIVALLFGLFEYSDRLYKDAYLKQWADKEQHKDSSLVVNDPNSQPKQSDSYEELIKSKSPIKSFNSKAFSRIWQFYNKLLYFYEIHKKGDSRNILCEYYIGIKEKEKNDPFSLMYEIGCLTSKQIFKKLREKICISSMILTSGTLQPFELIQQSMDVDFENHVTAHVINPQTNLYTKFIKSFGNCTIDMSFRNMQKAEIAQIVTKSSINAVIKIITTFIDVSKKTNNNGGILILFKSYTLMNTFQSQSAQLKQMIPDLLIFVEQKNSYDFKKDFQIYKEKILRGKHCVFCAVNRGKLSEGIDLMDTLCRVVVILGIPYPDYQDPYVQCKKKFTKEYQNESRWYEKQTVRVINQGAGRCIRHKDDWGCIFFIDQNFVNQHHIYNNISQWIKGGLKNENTLEKDIDKAWIDQYKQFLTTTYDDALKKDKLDKSLAYIYNNL